jgi:hypothetical protein
MTAVTEVTFCNYKGTNGLDLWILGQGGFLTGQAESPGSHDGSQSEMCSDEADSTLHDHSSRDSTGSSFQQSAAGASGGSQLAGQKEVSGELADSSDVGEEYTQDIKSRGLRPL